MHRRRIAALVALAATVVLAGCASPTGAEAGHERLTVYAAASLADAFDDIARAFEQQHPDVEVVTVYDGSRTLATQIVEGAPADVFASADEATLAAAGAAVGAPHAFASNTLVIAVPEGNPAGIRGLGDLARATVVLCAREVPCGAAAATLLDAAGVRVEAASLEQNVTAVVTKVAAREADAGIVYATDVRAAGGVDAVAAEGAEDVVNSYLIAPVADSPHAERAAAFAAYVRSHAGLGILADAGFGPP